uniref:Uncharacterized protein n=1 Tax=Romanomermis culicivorax TaxID=13658 RepID=A0A915KAC7_ROMCU
MESSITELCRQVTKRRGYAKLKMLQVNPEVSLICALEENNLDIEDSLEDLEEDEELESELELELLSLLLELLLDDEEEDALFCPISTVRVSFLTLLLELELDDELVAEFDVA